MRLSAPMPPKPVPQAWAGDPRPVDDALTAAAGCAETTKPGARRYFGGWTRRTSSRRPPARRNPGGGNVASPIHGPDGGEGAAGGRRRFGCRAGGAPAGRPPSGTVAVIGPNTNAVRKSLRCRGWAGSMHDPSSWERDGREVTVLDPDSARGIEFDAVVVVEPADFRQNRGASGAAVYGIDAAGPQVGVVHSNRLSVALQGM